MMLNGVLMTMSGKKLQKTVSELRAKGEVLSGEQKGFLFLRSYQALMAVDCKGVIQDARLVTTGFFSPGKVQRLDLEKLSIHAMPSELKSVTPFALNARNNAVWRYLRLQERKSGGKR